MSHPHQRLSTRFVLHSEENRIVQSKVQPLFSFCFIFHPNKQHLFYSAAVILLPSRPSLRSHSRKLSSQRHVAVLEKDSITQRVCSWSVLQNQPRLSPTEMHIRAPGYLIQPLSGLTRSNTNTRAYIVCTVITKVCARINEMYSLLWYNTPVFDGEMHR